MTGPTDPTDPTDPSDPYRRFAEAVLQETRRIALAQFRQPLDIQTKADESPVTVADRAVEAHIRARIAAVFPEHGIYGEEHGQQNLGAQHVWVIDPIDGTRSFISGMPLWGTLLALLDAGRPVFGVIDAPALGERWIGTAEGCFASTGADAGAATRCTTSGCTALAAANVSATSPDMFSGEEYAIFDTLSRRARFRRFGGDCYSYAMLAAGHIDAVVEAGLAPYDYLAVVPVIEGAGGVVTDWRGRPLGMGSDGRVLAAATEALHREMLAHTALLA